MLFIKIWRIYTFSLICLSFSLLSRLLSRLRSRRSRSSALDRDLSWDEADFSRSFVETASLREPDSSLLSLSLRSFSLRDFFSFSSTSPLDLMVKFGKKGKLILSDNRHLLIKNTWVKKRKMSENKSRISRSQQHIWNRIKALKKLLN